MSNKNQLKKKLQYGSISIVLVIVFIAAIVFGNMGVSFLTDRFNLKLDISAEGLYSISEQTEIMLKNLDQPVTAYILLSEAEVENSGGYAQANELLKRYVNMSDGKFNLEYVDIYKNPTFVQKYQTSSALTSGSIIIESEKRFKVLSSADLYEVSVGYTSSGTPTTYRTGFAADQAFASALHYITTNQLPTVVKIFGHGESYDSSFMNLFLNNNYTVTEINLSMEDIPANADLLLIGAPSSDFTEEEITKLDDYLSNSGNVMVFANVEAGEMPVFNRYFSEWGIGLKNEIVLDATRGLFGDASLVAPYIENSVVTESLSYNNNSIIVSPSSRGMEVLWADKGNRATEVVLSSSATAYSKDLSQGKIDSYEQAEGDTVGTFPLCVLSSQSVLVNNETQKSNVLFFASGWLANATFIEQQSLLNAKFLISAMNYMNPVVDAVSIEARDFVDSTLVILTETANAILVVTVFLIPLLIMGLGLFVWIRRKNK